MTAELIDKDTRLHVEVVVNDAVKDCRWIWLTYLTTGFNAALLLTVALVEADLLYHVFLGVVGENNDYWNPALLATTGIIMVAGFHLLGHIDHEHFLIRWIRKIIPYLILLYGLGAGLIAATLFNQDAVSAILSTTQNIIIGTLPQTPADKHWIEWFLQDITSPIALAVFSVGIGGLAMVNLFVAHELIHEITASVENIRAKKTKAQQLQSDYQTLLGYIEDYRKNYFDIGDMAFWTKKHINRETALQLSELIEHHKRRHEVYLKRREINAQPARHQPASPIDLKVIERDLKKIDGFDYETIYQSLSTLNPTEN